MVAIPEGVPAGQPETPGRAVSVSRYLKKLNLEHNLNLPWNEHTSPAKRCKSPGHDVAALIKFLYYQDPTALDRGYEDFRLQVASLRSEEQKVRFLVERLTTAKTDCLKARTPRSVKRSPGGHLTQSTDLPEPVSPTLAIKHAPPSSTEMSIDDFQLPAPRTTRMPSVKRPGSTQSLSDKLRASASRATTSPSATVQPATSHVPRSIPRAVERDLRDALQTTSWAMPPPSMSIAVSGQNSGLTSDDTSFTSNALTSAETSFWSEAPQGTQEDPPSSPATTVDGSFHTPKEENFGLDGAADLDMNGAKEDSEYGDFPSQVDPAQLDSDWVGYQVPYPNLTPAPDRASEQFDKPTVSQDTDYGFSSPMITSQLDCQCETDQNYTSNGQLASPAITNSSQTPHELIGLDRINHIAHDGLSSLQLPAWLLKLPFELRWEAARVLQTKELSTSELEAQWSGERTVESLHSLVKDRGITFAFGHKFDGNISFTADLRWTTSRSGRVFVLELRPPKADKSSCIEYEFGRERFLYVNLPSLAAGSDLPDLKEYKDSVEDKVLDMLAREQRLLGRIWRQFHVQTIKKTRAGDPDFGKAGANQLYFFAVRSEAHELASWRNVPIMDVWNWAVPFHPNRHMPVRKAFARMDLVESTTTASYRLSEHEIVRGVPDLMPTEDEDDTMFDDVKLGRNPMDKSSEPMNDGCNRMATWLMVQIQNDLRLDYTPSAVQGRISGTKGVWYRDNANPYCTQKPEQLIWLSKSQVKVLQAEGDLENSAKMTFQVVGVSKPLSCSEIYTSTLPIMADRHVPASKIASVVNSCTQALTAPFKEAFDSGSSMRHWMHCRNVGREEHSRETGIEDIGGFPVSREEQSNLMLESGFMPRTCHYLAEAIQGASTQIFADTLKQLKLEITCSTMGYGIADETGEVMPGEVHLIPSRPIDDSSEGPTNLAGRHAIVTRHPSLGPSDVQKMRIVQKESLAHLVDVLVFSTRGPCSQASKMQGGDYDGDKFWICWDPLLVQDFKNAPVRNAASKPEDYGIQVNRETLGNVLRLDSKEFPQEADLLAFIRIGTRGRLRFDPLGSITLALEKLTYDENDLRCAGASTLLQLHGHMIDADKQGYLLPNQEFNHLKAAYRIDRRPEPAFRRLLKGETGSIRPKSGNIVDDVIFNIVKYELDEATRFAADVAKHAPRRDEQLDTFFDTSLARYTEGGTAHREISALADKVEALKDCWKMYSAEYGIADKGRKTQAWRRCLTKIRADFDNIMPDDGDSGTARAWLDHAGNMHSMWSLLKAGALARSKVKPKVMFAAAGTELCFIKASQLGRLRMMTMDAYTWLKPRGKKRKAEGNAAVEEIGDEVVGPAELG